jgi:hypothetical protein
MHACTTVYKSQCRQAYIPAGNATVVGDENLMINAKHVSSAFWGLTAFCVEAVPTF